MDKIEFSRIIDSLQVVKSIDANGSPTLRVTSPEQCKNISASNSPESVYREKGHYYVAPFNSIIRAVARRLNYTGYIKDLYLTSASEVNRHEVVAALNKATNDVVYIRSKRGYNNHGSRKGTSTSRKGVHTYMKNRKVTLTLFTLVSGFALTLQITGSSKDATAWTRFCDPDLSKAEYDNITWTKDVESANKEAVAAVDAMIQIEEDFVAGNLTKEQAVEQFKEKYIEFVVAHLNTNPEFVERRIPGLNVEDPMAAYRE